MEQKDHYQVLGLEQGASKEQIQRAFHTLAKRYHPDHAKDDAEAAQRFREVTAAYQALTDESELHYSTLGLTKGASVADIQRAYYQVCDMHYKAMKHGDKEAEEIVERAKRSHDFLIALEEKIDSQDKDTEW